MIRKNTFLFLLLIVSVAFAGCVANSQDNGIGEDDTQTADVTDKPSPSTNANSDEIQNVRIVNSEPIQYDNVRSYEVYWDWHNTTSDLLKEQIGTDIQVYCYSLSYTGELKEVGKYFILLDDTNRGLVYVDIDQITAIAKEGANAVASQSSGSSSVRGNDVFNP
nr:hypothetical protein [uncultured Methanolobus sp.]